MTSRLSRRRFLQAAAGFALAARDALAAPPRPVSGEVSRRVLALYKSHETAATPDGPRPKNATLNTIHQWAQMPLNWLGLMVEYHDIDAGLPDEAVMAGYRGVVSWFSSEEMDDPRTYLQWLGAQVTAGRRVVVLGTVGASHDRRSKADLSLEEMSKALGPLGLEFRGHWSVDPRVIEVRQRDALMEFERKFSPGLPGYFQVVATRPDSRPHLTLGRKDLPDSDSHMVVTGPWGGFAGGNYAIYQASPFSAGTADPRVADAAGGAELYGARWWLDPFAFFGAALGVEDWPRPDVTTFNGRRIYYSHIDGDGMRNLSEIRRGALSGEIVDAEVLARYPVPITVSVVTAEIDPALLGSPRTFDLARRMLGRPNVEAGSHSFTHPLDWEKRTTSITVAGYRVSLDGEIGGSVRFIEERLLPAGKRVKVFQWSGSTRVSEEAIAAVDRLGIPNINGGDSMRDRQWPSYARVAPLMRQVGHRWQSYTSASNENLYTRLWTGPFYGFRAVLETFRGTETPRRVAPVNVYSHFYSGERRAALEALRTVYDWVRTQSLALLFTSDYLAMVEGFRTARLERLAVPAGAIAAWRVWNHGALRTLRFDATTAAVDLTRSRGVLGFAHHQGALYVHLNDAPEAVVVLTNVPATRPYLASASHGVSDFLTNEGVIAFRLEGVGAKSAAIAGLAAGARLHARLIDARGTRTVPLVAGANGSVSVDAGDAPRVDVRIT